MSLSPLCVWTRPSMFRKVALTCKHRQKEHDRARWYAHHSFKLLHEDEELVRDIRDSHARWRCWQCTTNRTAAGQAMCYSVTERNPKRGVGTAPVSVSVTWGAPRRAETRLRKLERRSLSTTVRISSPNWSADVDPPVGAWAVTPASRTGWTLQRFLLRKDTSYKKVALLCTSSFTSLP